MTPRELRDLIRALELPSAEILFVHLRLRGLAATESYARVSRQLLMAFQEWAAPTTILVPTFTYSFTSCRRFDRKNSPCEVGRFGEETRTHYARALRTMNPVFSCIDTAGYFTIGACDETSAFGERSLLDRLAQEGYVVVNLNLPSFVATHLHYLEYRHQVPYRFTKRFYGHISDDGEHFWPVQYAYYVRQLTRDTRWRREKIEGHLKARKALHFTGYRGIRGLWVRSQSLDEIIGEALQEDPHFLITDS